MLAGLSVTYILLAPAIGFELSVSTTGFIGSLYTSLHLLIVILLYFLLQNLHPHNQ